MTTPTAPLTTAADWARAFSGLLALPEDAADAFLAKTYAICDSGSWRTAMIGFLTTYAAQVRRDVIEECAKLCDRRANQSSADAGSARDHDEIVKRISMCAAYEAAAFLIRALPPGSPSSQTDTGDGNV